MIASLALCLALTLAAEGLIVLPVTRSLRLTGLSVLGNLATNPTVNLLLWVGVRLLGAGAYVPILAASEVGAVALEAWIYTDIGGLTRAKGVLLSLLCNAVALALGWWLLSR